MVAPKISVDTALRFVLYNFLYVVVLEAVWAPDSQSVLKRSCKRFIQAGVLCGVVLIMHVFFLIMIQWLRSYVIVFCYFAIFVVLIFFLANLLLSGSLFVKKEKFDLFFEMRVFWKNENHSYSSSF